MSKISSFKEKEFKKRLKRIIENDDESIGNVYKKNYVFANEVGIQASKLSLYLSGKSLPNLETFSKIVEISNVSADYFLFGKEPKEIFKIEDKNFHNTQKIMEAFDVLIANNLIKETSKYSFNLNLTDNQANFLSSINQIYKDGCSSKRDYEYKESIYKKYKEDFFVPNPEDDPKRSYKERCEIKEVKKRLNQKSRY